MKITKEELAAKLNGRERGDEITFEDQCLALKSNLFVLFGASDDLLEVRGAQYDEFGAYGGNDFSIKKKGILEIPEEDSEVLDRYGVLDTVLADSGHVKICWGKGKYTWSFETKIPHAKFDIFSGDELFCQGIVISQEDI